MSNNNEYLKIKIAQLEARKAAIEEESVVLDERIESYTAQLVDEPDVEEIDDDSDIDDDEDSDPPKFV